MELLSMGASTVLGGILGIMAQASKDKAEQQKMMFKLIDLQVQLRKILAGLKLRLKSVLQSLKL